MGSDDNKEVAINWRNHMDHVKRVFDDLLSAEELIDVTLYCEGQRIGAHKVLLSACSDYFRDVFKEIPCQHPVIFLKGVEYAVLVDILRFVYSGEVNIETTNLDSFLQTAELLQINGLTDCANNIQQQAKKVCKGETSAEDETKDIKVSKSTTKSRKRKLRRKKMESQRKKIKDEEETFLSDLQIEPSEDPLESIVAEECDEQSVNTLINFSDEKSVLKLEDKKQIDGNGNVGYQCDICGKTYRLKDSLYKHSSVHTGSTRCKICSRVLSRKTHLERHMLTNHGINFKDLNQPENPINC